MPSPGCSGATPRCRSCDERPTLPVKTYRWTILTALIGVAVLGAVIYLLVA
jgi:hypothetical protein